MKFLAVLKDSWIQTLDCKSLYVMIAVSALFILLCASISYSPMDERDVMQNLTRHLGTVAQMRRRPGWKRSIDVTSRVADVRDIPQDGGDFAGGYAFTLTIESVKEFHEAIRLWDGVEKGLVIGKDDAAPAADVSLELEEKFLRAKFREQLIPRVAVESRLASQDSRSYEVRIRPISRANMEGAYRVHFFFGLVTWSMGDGDAKMSVATLLLIIQYFISEWMAGLVGILIALVFTASFIPNMLQRGSLDVLLARPVSRARLLAYRYVGGLLYAAISGLVLIGGSWLVLSARSGVWNWGYLATLGTLMLFFAVLYSIGLFAAVLTRSTIAAMATPAAAWGLGFVVTLAKDIVRLRLDAPSWVNSGFDVVSWILPRAHDFNVANQYFMIRGSLGSGVDELAAQAGAPEVAWVTMLISSAALIVAMVSFSCWIFSRRDN